MKSIVYTWNISMFDATIMGIQYVFNVFTIAIELKQSFGNDKKHKSMKSICLHSSKELYAFAIVVWNITQTWIVFCDRDDLSVNNNETIKDIIVCETLKLISIWKAMKPCVNEWIMRWHSTWKHVLVKVVYWAPN